MDVDMETGQLKSADETAEKVTEPAAETKKEE